MKPSQNDSRPADRSQMAPGDEARPGTPGTGEDICPQCHGSGKKAGQRCESCAGTGKIIRGIGGA